MGWDFQFPIKLKYQVHFNPPTPHGVGPAIRAQQFGILKKISIHPPRMGWDQMPSERCFLAKNFNPPTPHGVGQQVRISMHIYFQISIHPPRMGWDIAILHPLCGNKNFNPPTPHGVGRCRGRTTEGAGIFQSTHPAWGGTSYVDRISSRILKYFNPPTPHGVGQWIRYGGNYDGVISIHPPRMGWDQ